MYKVFWTTPSLDGQATDADLIAAVNQAIIDGVDVLSCSWGSPASDKSLHSFDYIFMNAAQVREEVISDAEGCEKCMKSLAIVRKLYCTPLTSGLKICTMNLQHVSHISSGCSVWLVMERFSIFRILRCISLSSSMGKEEERNWCSYLRLWG